MKRFNCTLSDKRGEFGECMEAHGTGRYVLFSDAEKLQQRMQDLLDKSNRTGVAIERAISRGSVLDDHPLKSRLELLANHHKREQELADGMVAMAGRCTLLADLLREARNPLITAMDASGEDESTETEELLERIDSVLAGNLPERRITKPARVWGARFMPGIPEQTIIEAAYRYAEHESSPEEKEAGKANFDLLMAAVHKIAPEGWQLVPVVPTKAMREAFHEAHEEWESWNDWRLDSPDHQWHAMLAAAPKHQGGEPCATEPPLSSKA